MPQVRIGIDVGGTFTHAVALDDATYKLIGEVKVLTTHNAPEGVAAGIIQSLNQLLKKSSINPSDITFLAHSTTQATNSLLEGDVTPVGVIGMGKGLEGYRAKGETRVGDIELAPGKILRVYHRFVDSRSEDLKGKIERGIKEQVTQGAKGIVASEAFGVDDPRNERLILEIAKNLGMPATASHEISGLYGLRIRTRTSVINTSILPKMIETANMTEEAVKQTGIKAPLMIMRSDGGVMKAEEMRKRPILTILSGPAAGVAGALMYVKISDAIFIEIGGTSTDISVIRNGRALVKSAEVGGHRLYLRTLDTRTIGVAGGSLPRIEGNRLVGVGSRSAHIVGLPYACFTKSEEIPARPAGGKEPELVLIKPKAEDPLYSAIRTAEGKTYAVTPTCAANILGLVSKENYAYGNADSARLLIKPLAQRLGKSIEETAEEILRVASQEAIRVIEKLIKDYKLRREGLVLVGGGGGAAALVPYIAELMNLEYEISANEALVSAIGVALAMVHETVERTIVNPTEKDVLRLRAEAEEAVVKMGAAPETVEVHIEIDQQRSMVRASAFGATELRRRDLLVKEIPELKRKEIAAQSMKIKIEEVKLLASTGLLDIFGGERVEIKLLGLIKERRQTIRVIDREGIIRKYVPHGVVVQTTKEEAVDELKGLLDKYTKYGDAGERLPDISILFRSRIVDLSGLINSSQIVSLAGIEIKSLEEGERVVLIAGM